MENVTLGREVIDQADADPRSFSMFGWAHQNTQAECGTVACLGGWAMLKSGYTWGVDSHTFRSVFTRPDGSVVHSPDDEAAYLLGMSEDEEYGDEYRPIWYDYENGLDRFRKLVEAAEGAL